MNVLWPGCLKDRLIVIIKVNALELRHLHIIIIVCLFEDILSGARHFVHINSPTCWNLNFRQDLIIFHLNIEKKYGPYGAKFWSIL
jgi:hypothetical protein